MSKKHRIVMIGATGAVGSITAKTLSKRKEVSHLSLLGRRPLNTLKSCDQSDTSIEQQKIDIFDSSSYAKFLENHDTAICTLGVGEPSKMSKEEFIKIDKMAVLDFATACKESGVEHFELLSSVGTSSNSPSFYLRSKGELEDALANLNFARLSIFKPSMILTPENRYGLSQAAILALWPAISHALIGPMSKYKGIKVESLGKSIAANALIPGAGEQVFHWADFKRLYDSV